MIMATKRKTTKRKYKSPRKKRTISKYKKSDSESKFHSRILMDAIIERIKKHKLRFDLDYEKGIYDLTPQEADIYDDSIDDILTIIRKM